MTGVTNRRGRCFLAPILLAWALSSAACGDVRPRPTGGGVDAGAVGSTDAGSGGDAGVTRPTDGGGGLADAGAPPSTVSTGTAATVMKSASFSLVAAPGQGDSSLSSSPSFRLHSGAVGVVPQPK
jgi:hypothetical protein